MHREEAPIYFLNIFTSFLGLDIYSDLKVVSLRPLVAAKKNRPPISITVSNMTPKNYPK